MLTKDVFFFFRKAEPAQDADNAKFDCTERQLQNDLLSLHNAHLDGRHADYSV